MNQFLLLLAVFAATAPAAPPSAELNYFVGNWHCDGHFVPSQKPIAATLRFTLQPETGALHKTHKDDAPGTYVAQESWSYSKSTGLYRAAIEDAGSGLRWYVATGWASDASWSWVRVATPGEPQEAFVYTRLDANSMQVDWKISRAGGPLSIGDTLTCRRV